MLESVYEYPLRKRNRLGLERAANLKLTCVHYNMRLTARVATGSATECPGHWQPDNGPGGGRTGPAEALAGGAAWGPGPGLITENREADFLGRKMGGCLPGGAESGAAARG